VRELVKRLEEGQKKSSENGDGSWPLSEEYIINLKEQVFGKVDEKEASIEEEVRMLDEMIERTEKTSQEDGRLEETLALLNAVSQAEMRRDRCGETQGKEELSPDGTFRDMIQRAAREVLEDLQKDDG
jgi:hypothetical protein